MKRLPRKTGGNIALPILFIIAITLLLIHATAKLGVYMNKGDVIVKAKEHFKHMYDHLRTGSVYIADDGTLAVVPVVYSFGAQVSLAVVVLRKYHHLSDTFEMVALDTELQHIGSDWNLGQVQYFFDQEYGFTEFPCFALGIRNDTTEGGGVEGDILLIDPYSRGVVSAVKKAKNYARTGAFLGATVELAKTTNGWDGDSAVQILCTNGCKYTVEGNGTGLLKEADWRADF